MCSTGRCCGFAAAGFPIRKSSDQRLYTASRGLSQCPASFIGIWRQGIHRKPLVASPRDAEKLVLFGLHHTNQLLFSCQGSVSPLTGERCPPLSSRTRLNVQLLSTRRPGSPPGRKLPCVSSQHIQLEFRVANFKSFIHPFKHSPVEMTGFEPVAFALQRRCSPAELHPQALPEISGGPDWTRTSDPSLIRTVL
jgi:hypothetical protein